MFLALTKTHLGVYHYFDNKEVLHNMDYCLPDTRNQDECPRTAELLTQENQAENKRKV